MRTVPAHIQAALASPIKVGEFKVAGRITVEPSWWLHASSALPPRYAPAPSAPFTEDMVYALFHYYGYTTDDEIANAVQNPPPTETAAERVTRITLELNRAGPSDRNWEQVETSIRGLPQIVETGRWQHSKTPLRWWQKADNCVDDETEILTRRGWLTHDLLKEGDHALAINPETGCSEWVEIEHLNLTHVSNREMLLMESNSHSSLTTLDHRWLVRTTKSAELQWETSRSLHQNHRVPLCAPPAHAPHERTMSDEMVELVAWFWTEGSWAKQSSAELSQCRCCHMPEVERIRACLRTLYGDPGPMVGGPRLDRETVEAAIQLHGDGHSAREVGRRLGIDHTSVLKYVRRADPLQAEWNEVPGSFPNVSKFILSALVGRDLARFCDRETKAPSMEFLCTLTQPQLDLFIKISMAADGERGATPRLSQTNKDRSDAFQAACVLAGVGTSQRNSRDFSVTLRKRTHARPVANARNRAHKSGAICDTVRYSGVIWCPTVRHGNWLARRRGHTYFTGNSQREVEIPNLRTISIDRSLDSPAATLTFTIVNQKMHTNAGEGGVPTELGQPGYYWPLRGQSPEALARWGQQPNEWRNVLVQNALLRVYWGYGGEDKTLADALTFGNLMIEGVFLIDSVSASTDGTITIKARDMMRLLIEQQLFVPLVPLELYPLAYYRWIYKNVEVHAQARDTTTIIPGSGSTSPVVQSGSRQCNYADSSTDHWSPIYGLGGPGSNSPLHGHYPSESIDQDPNTYWMSNGNARPDAAFAFDWIEFDVGGEAINAVYVNPWGGNYTAYVSVMVNGEWQGDPNVPIPYDPSELYATQTTVDTGASIPYVATFTIPWEQAGEYWLPNIYAAERVRITLHDGFDSGLGPFVFREGIREFGVLVSSGAPQTTASGQQLTTSQHLEPLFFAADAFPGPYPAAGFITCDTFGQVDAFGDARILPKTGGGGLLGGSTPVVAIRYIPDGTGYHIMDNRGHIASYGNAQYFGRIDTELVIFDMAITHTGLGYHMIGPHGETFAFGDANSLNNPDTPAPLLTLSIETHPSDYGTWILRSDGHVDAQGAAVHYGEPAAIPGDSWVRIRATSTGLGYWVMSNYGKVQAFGDAVAYGSITQVPTEPAWSGLYWGIMPGSDDLGYQLMRGDGAVFPIGAIDDFGGPIPGSTAELRYDGNYRFYEDIIKDLLLWSGFWLKEDLGPLDEPQVFGTIEATGVYAHDSLDPALFDKKPVIDAINTLKEVVGFNIYLSPDGGFNFVAPNVFQAGNFFEDGTHTDVVPEIDEKIDLFSYGVQLPAGPLRSEIIISSEKVDPHAPSTQTVTYTPPTAQLLRGMVRPAIWTNQHFDNRNESKIMAELIALQIYFQLRLGSVHSWYNPAIEINDQVRVLERQTSETYFQWVRGMNVTMDLDQGTVLADYTTSWLGTESDWTVARDDVSVQQTGWISKFLLTDATISWLQSNPRKVRVPELRGPLSGAGPTYGSGSNLGETPTGTGAAGGS